jgi:hypothetical protein
MYDSIRNLSGGLRSSEGQDTNCQNVGLFPNFEVTLENKLFMLLRRNQYYCTSETDDTNIKFSVRALAQNIFSASDEHVAFYVLCTTCQFNICAFGPLAAAQSPTR